MKSPCRSSSTTILLIVASWLCFLARTTTAINAVSSPKECYAANENFVITFNLTKPQSGDLIGVVRVSTNAVVVTVPTCAQKSCSTPPAFGTLSIRQSLALGFYKVALLRSNKKSVLATSSNFRVQQLCVPTTAPSKSPTQKPTPLPTKKPTKKPTKRPTKVPTPSPTASPSAFSPNTAAHQALNEAADVIAGMVLEDSRLTPEFLRLGFHDCIRVCDGCIDLSNPDNFGIGHAIGVLDPVVEQFANSDTGLSRADIWALAVTVGTDVAEHGLTRDPVSFTLNTFGRVNCEDANTECRDRFGQVTPCAATSGPHRHMASPTFNTAQTFSFFAEEFGFDERQSVTILGAHTVGHMVPAESGIDGPNGWTFDNVVLQNEYYQALMGVADVNTPDSQIAALSPRWRRAFRNNTGTIFPNRHTWGLSLGGKQLVMLDSDISIVRDLNPSNQNSVTGETFCAFNPATANGASVCPITATARIAAEFANDNDLWLGEFRDTLDLMLTNGYTRDDSCSDPVCPLTMIPGIGASAPATESLPTAPPTTAPVAKPTAAPVAKPASSGKPLTSQNVVNQTSSSGAPPTFTPTVPSPPIQFKIATPSQAAASVPPTAKPSSIPVETTLPPVPVTASPTPSPTVAPTESPTLAAAIVAPTSAPVAPTSAPVAPTSAPVAPTSAPVAPTSAPVAPTSAPVAPTSAPVAPTTDPTTAPVVAPTGSPTLAPILPTLAPVLVVPTIAPFAPTASPTTTPVAAPTGSPTLAPVLPTSAATLSPTGSPTQAPLTTDAPVQPTTLPTPLLVANLSLPTDSPTSLPVGEPTP